MSERSIVCASSLAGGQEMFSTLGRVTVLPESEINTASLRGVDALFTRSKVRVNDALLEGACLSFYGTATAGIDHIDVSALERRGIAWAHAPGSNANSVAEYVIAALAHLGRTRQINWRRKTLGIIGAGHVGARLAKLAHALGLTVLLNDPPLFDATGDPVYLPLPEVLAHADIVSLHVPLTDSGKYPTRGMVDDPFLARLKFGLVFINSSRGEVVDEAALTRAVHDHRFSALVLDVFDHEPGISVELVRAATLATPHIAGYSYDGRLKGTEMIYQAACRHFKVAPVENNTPGAHPLHLIAAHPPWNEPRALYDVILDAYNPALDDQRLRGLPVGAAMATHFNTLRKNYPKRREFHRFAVHGENADPAFLEGCAKLGFHVSSAP